MTVSANPLSIQLPRGECASFAEMQGYGSILQSFICSQEALLEDIEDVKHHNDTVDYLQSLANSYNEQLRIYKEAEAQRQRNMFAALMRSISA